jgi:hypothetical protein
MNTNERQLSKIKDQLVEIYRTLPEQFTLSKTKNHLKNTIDSITEVQTKRKRRQIEQQREDMKKPVFFGSLEDAQAALKALDKMMQEEQNKIDSQNNTDSQKNTSNELLNG